MRKLLVSLSTLLLLAACTPSAKPIEYGADKCEFCRMTIVDQQHAAEVVTTKGKVHKFDAIECMVHYTQEHADTEFALFLVNDYLDGGVLVDALVCSYLISPNLPSPMGANLSAFTDAQAAKAWQKDKGGELYSWESLQAQLKQ